MGQVAMKLKEFFFRRKTTSDATISQASVRKEKEGEKEEKNRSGSSQAAHVTKLDEVKSVESHTENKTETGGKDNSYEDRHLSIKEYSKQMGFLEKVIDEQRKLIEEHNHKLATIEKILQRRLPQENASLSESDQKEEKEKVQESFVDQIIENVFEQKQLKSTCKEVQEQQQTIGEQAKSLKAQEERLESQQTKIEIIREMLEEDKGVYCRGKRAKAQLDRQDKRLNEQEESLKNLQMEFKEELKAQQNQLDNLLAGFFVAFFVIVLLIMLPRY